mgnify:CR=1 FL=1
MSDGFDPELAAIRRILELALLLDAVTRTEIRKFSWLTADRQAVTERIVHYIRERTNVDISASVVKAKNES